MFKKHLNWGFISLLILLSLTTVVSLSLGYSKSSLSDIWKLILGQADSGTLLIIGNIRLPRILACVVGGGSLSLAGVLLQTLTKNPLADSGILGINTGAGLIIAVTAGLSNTNNPHIVALTPIFAMLGGATTILLVYLISRRKNHSISPNRLIISGVGISSLLSGLMVTIVSNLDDFKTAYVVQWLSGRISGGNWTSLAIFTPLLLLTWSLTYSRSNSLNIMALNDQTALALGLNLQKERIINLLLATALASLSVVLVGNITFVGLVAGHIGRRLFGTNHRILLPAGLLLGMIILLIADTIGRVILIGTGIPTGIIVSIIGAPYFLYLMTKIKM